MDAKGTAVNYSGPEDYQSWIDTTYADYEKVAVKIGMYKKK